MNTEIKWSVNPGYLSFTPSEPCEILDFMYRGVIPNGVPAAVVETVKSTIRICLSDRSDGCLTVKNLLQETDSWVCGHMNISPDDPVYWRLGGISLPCENRNEVCRLVRNTAIKILPLDDDFIEIELPPEEGYISTSAESYASL